jgi:hypothetical protein
MYIFIRYFGEGIIVFMLGAGFGHLEITRILINAGSNINKRNGLLTQLKKGDTT